MPCTNFRFGSQLRSWFPCKRVRWRARRYEFGDHHRGDSFHYWQMKVHEGKKQQTLTRTCTISCGRDWMEHQFSWILKPWAGLVEARKELFWLFQMSTEVKSAQGRGKKSVPKRTKSDDVLVGHRDISTTTRSITRMWLLVVIWAANSMVLAPIPNTYLSGRLITGRCDRIFLLATKATRTVEWNIPKKDLRDKACYKCRQSELQVLVVPVLAKDISTGWYMNNNEMWPCLLCW